MCSLIQEMGGGPKDLHRDPTAGQIGAVGGGGDHPLVLGGREGAHPPLGGRGAPEEQDRLMFANIFNSPSGVGPPIAQAPAPIQ